MKEQNLYNNGPAEIKENVLAGIVGAFLFSLVGGVLWFVIYMFGFIAGISGLVGAICAIKGYTVFAKKESTKGIVISVVIALLVMVLAWYFCLAYDVYNAYQDWYAAGDIDFTITFAEAVGGAYIFLSEPDIAPAYFGDLAMGLIFCVIGGGSYVVNKIRNAKAKANAPAPAAAAPVAENANVNVGEYGVPVQNAAEEVKEEAPDEAVEEAKEEPAEEVKTEDAPESKE